MRTIAEIVEELKSCGFECEAGPLEMNKAFVELEELANHFRSFDASRVQQLVDLANMKAISPEYFESEVRKEFGI